MQRIQSLIDGTDQWYPTSINSYRSSFKFNCDLPSGSNLRDVKSNLSYNFQYLEYILVQLEELKLSKVIEKNLYKNFVITGMSIVELSFYIILLNQGKIERKENIEVETFKSTDRKKNGLTVWSETNIYTKIDDSNELDPSVPTLDTMIKKIKKCDIKGLTSDDLPVLKNLRKLRNHVHLQVGENVETDYNSFDIESLELMKRILYHLFGSEETIMSSRPELFEYLKPKTL